METPVRGIPSEITQASTQTPNPYPPSWIDRIMETVERWPIPYGLVYLLAFGLQALLMHLLSWLDGWLAPLTFSRLNLIYPLWLWGPLAIMTFLDRVALTSLRNFAPLLALDDREKLRLEYEFTTMPVRPVWGSTIFWMGVYGIVIITIHPTFYNTYSVGPIGIASASLFGLFTFLIGSTLYYHTLRQLRLVRHTVGRVAEFNLFRLDPVYAFSNLTALTGLAWLVLLSLVQFMFPFQLVNSFAILLYFGQILLGLAAFVLPLWSVHTRLLNEKHRLEYEANRRVEAAISRMHRFIDEDKSGEVDGINSVLAGLTTEREILAKIPTWPWRSGTFNGLITALVLPIVLFLVQLIIERWLN